MIKDNINLSNLITGSLLGDGAIIASFDKRQNSMNYYYSESHGKSQMEYLEWKQSFFKEEGFSCNISFRDRKSSFGEREVASREYRFHVYGNKIFKPMRDYWYIDSHKQVPLDIELNPFNMAVWYMDDGSYDVFRGKIELSSYGFDLQSHKVLQSQLKSKYNINMEIALRNKKGKQYYYTYLSRNEAWKFLLIVEPFIHKTLKYKIPQGYKLHSNPIEKKEAKRTVSTKISIEEAQLKIVSSLRNFWEINGSPEDGFPIVKYLYWENSFSHKPIQRLFGSFAAALLSADIPENFI